MSENCESGLGVVLLCWFIMLLDDMGAALVGCVENGAFIEQITFIIYIIDIPSSIVRSDL